MIALAKGVEVYVAGRRYVKEIPADLCPDHLKPAAPAPERRGRTAQAEAEPEHG